MAHAELQVAICVTVEIITFLFTEFSTSTGLSENFTATV